VSASLAAAIVLGTFLVLLVLGVRVFIAMGLSAGLGFWLLLGPDQAIRDFAAFLWQSSAIFEFIAIPLFVFAGAMIQRTGFGSDVLRLANLVVGRIPNALAVAVVIASAFFASICGSTVANAATLSLVAVPLLEEEGYPEGMRGAVVAAGGALGMLLPPSIPLIIYGVLTDTSIGQLFVAGIIPGLLTGVAFAIYLVFFARVRIQRREGPRGNFVDIFLRSLPLLVLPLLIVGAIFSGYMTPSEVGALAAIYMLALGLIRKRLTLKIIAECAKSAALTSTMLIMLVATGLMFSQFLSLAQLPQQIATVVQGISPLPVVVVTAMTIAYLIMGTFLESAAMLIVSIPIFFPIAGTIGMSAVQFGIFATLNQEVAQIHPPLGINLITVSAISKIRLESLMLSVLPYIAMQLIMIYIVYFVPALVTWLPSKMLGH
jgi:C4-dicarboxylate transporter DctM subunit